MTPFSPSQFSSTSNANSFVTQTTQTISDKNRKDILSAAVNGDEQTVRAMLDKDPTLIGATIGSNGNSLLHVAVGKGHESICRLLIEKGHATNPVNLKGQTPYEWAASAVIRQLLVDSHIKALCEEIYLVSPKIKSVEIMDKISFQQCLSKHTMVQNLFSTVRVSNLVDGSGTVKDFYLSIYFREDILMTPCYGSLLVRYGLEKAKLLSKACDTFVKDNPSQSQMSKLLVSQDGFFEAQALIVMMADGLERFPFLNHLPQTEDNPDIANAKKLYLASAMNKLYVCFHQCTKENQDSLVLSAANTKLDILNVIKKRNDEQNALFGQYHEDIRAKYH